MTQKKETNSSENTEIELSRITRAQMEDVQDYQSAVQLAAQTFGGIVESDDFEQIENKDQLVNIPFLILNWEYGKKSDYGDDNVYVLVYAVIAGGSERKIFFSDGGTGIRKRLEKLKERDGRTGGISCKRGLRFSEYGLDKNNNPVPLGDPSQSSKGKTYYL